MLAVIETHPVQYHAPVYRLVQQRHGIPVTAIYGSDFSVAGYRDTEFGTTFAWDSDLLSGYSSLFLSRVAAGGARSADEVTIGGLSVALRTLRPSAVMTVGYSPRFHREAWLAAWRAGHALLFRGETTDHARQRPWWKQLGRDASLRLAYRTCAQLLYVGSQSRRHFERLGIEADRLVFSPYCVDTSVFATGDQARDAFRGPTRLEIGAAAGDLVLLFSGKLSARKGVDLLVEAVRRLPAGLRERAVIAFLGDGALAGELAHAAAAAPEVRAVFLGFQNQRQLSRYYHAADLLVLPSRSSETWGLVVNEALHHGVPCVVSDRVGCAADLIDERSTGRTCAGDDPAALAAAIESAAVLCGRDEVRAACRSRVAGYSTERAAAGIAAAYAAATQAGKAA